MQRAPHFFSPANLCHFLALFLLIYVSAQATAPKADASIRAFCTAYSPCSDSSPNGNRL